MWSIYDLTTPGIRIYPEEERTIVTGYLPGVMELTADIRSESVVVEGQTPEGPFREELPIEHPIDSELAVVVWQDSVLRMLLPRKHD